MLSTNKRGDLTVTTVVILVLLLIVVVVFIFFAVSRFGAFERGSTSLGDQKFCGQDGGTCVAAGEPCTGFERSGYLDCQAPARCCIS